MKYLASSNWGGTDGLVDRSRDEGRDTEEGRAGVGDGVASAAVILALDGEGAGLELPVAVLGNRDVVDGTSDVSWVVAAEDELAAVLGAGSAVEPEGVLVLSDKALLDKVEPDGVDAVDGNLRPAHTEDTWRLYQHAEEYSVRNIPSNLASTKARPGSAVASAKRVLSTFRPPKPTTSSETNPDMEPEPY